MPAGRERPDGSNNQSFPSGHTITAFCFAPVVQKYWGWGLERPLTRFGTVTALARVAGYHHYLSDTLAGSDFPLEALSLLRQLGGGFIRPKRREIKRGSGPDGASTGV